MSVLLRASVLIALCSVGSQLSAEVPPTAARPDVIAGWLAAEGCPKFLAGEFALIGNKALTGLGFSVTTEKRIHPRFGELEVTSLPYTGGFISFGGLAEQLCTTTVTGTAAKAALPRLRQAMNRLDYKFEPDASLSRPLGGVAKVETFKAKISNEGSLVVQIIDSTDAPNPAVTYQIAGMEN